MESAGENMSFSLCGCSDAASTCCCSAGLSSDYIWAVSCCLKKDDNWTRCQDPTLGSVSTFILHYLYCPPLASFILPSEFISDSWWYIQGKCCAVTKGNTVQGVVVSREHVARKQVYTWIHFGPCGSLCAWKCCLFTSPQKWSGLLHTHTDTHRDTQTKKNLIWVF